MKYEDITIENCFILYHEKKIASECNADKEEVIFCKE